MPVSRTMRTWGIKYFFRKNRWELSLAYFQNADFSGTGGDTELSASRYAYDIAGRDKEVHQGNVRVVYHFGNLWRHQLGGSVLVGGLYNMDTRKTGFRSDFALHYVVDYQWWNLKIHKLFLDSICLYNDFSLLNKRIAGFNDSLENVTGCSLTMGKVFSYIDYAVGRNHAWLGDV